MTVWMNDVHSRLNRTGMVGCVSVTSVDGLRAVFAGASSSRTPVSLAGGRHAMGGQQFANGGFLVDTSQLDAVLGIDQQRGLVKAEAGIQWPALMKELARLQEGEPNAWGIRQKQTGADTFSLGGSIAANIHGRGLTMRPFVDDVEDIELVQPDGQLLTVSRTINPELFSLVMGGYGLFGAVTAVTLRLARRQLLERVVELRSSEELPELFAGRIRDGFLYGDFQFSCDEASDDFLNAGVFSCYRPVRATCSTPMSQKSLTADDWNRLIHLAHAAKGEAFRQYARYYQSTSGQLYWSDTHQMSVYLDDYHKALDCRLGATTPATEMIGELCVPRDELARFLAETRADFRRHAVNVIYGTIRLIEEDRESFLPWARQPYACVIFNIHTEHTTQAIAKTRDAFVRLITRAIGVGGSYYLTYHRWAQREQVERCYPRMREFMKLKLRYDETELLRTDWYLAMRQLFAD
jgi:FAD/FMN-containing dehydrogenase